MRLLSGFFDRVILVAGVVAGGTIPSFVAQYRQRLGGALDQVLRDLAPFQEIASRQFGGDMRALVEHHMRSTDATFRSEGAAIQTMLDSAQRLSGAARALDTDLFHQMLYMLGNADSPMLAATWAIFKPAFDFSTESLVLAALAGLLLWLCFLGLWFAPAALWQRFANRRPHHAYRR